jgi:hypothetical protein
MFRRFCCAMFALSSMSLLIGCNKLGIDTRPEIEYVTLKQNQSAIEPMYFRPVQGTSLVKRWPKRLGQAYGYAPWEKPPSGMTAAPGDPNDAAKVASNAPTPTESAAPAPNPTSKSGLRQPAKLASHTEPVKTTAEEPTADAGELLDADAWKKRAKTPTLRRTVPQ